MPAGSEDLVLKISADTAAVASGLAPMTRALDNLADEAEQTDDALRDLSRLDMDLDTAGVDQAVRALDRLGDEAASTLDAVRELDGQDVELDIQEQALRRARDRIDDLYDVIAEGVVLGVDTKAAERELSTLQSTVRRLSARPHTVDVDVDVDQEGVRGVEALREGVNETTRSLGDLGRGFTGVTGLAMAMVPALADLNETLADHAAKQAEAGRSMSRFGRGAMAVTGIMAGPWGLAIAAGVGLLALWAESSEDAEEATQKFSDSLDFQAGVLDENNRRIVATELQTKGLLDQAREFGVSTSDLVSALLGEADAMARVNEQIRNTRLMGVPSDRLNEFAEFSDRVFIMGEGIARASERAAVLELAIGDLGDQAADTAAGLDAHEQAWMSLTRQIDATESELDTLIGTLDLFQGRSATAREATAAYEESLDRMTEALKENGKTTRDHGKTLDLTTEAGRENDEMVRTLARNIATVAEARLSDMEASGESTDQILNDYERQRKSLVDTAVRMGLTRQAAERYVDQLLKTPDDIPTKVTLQGIATAEKQLDELTEHRTASVTVKLAVDKFSENAVRRRIREVEAGNLGPGTQSTAPPAPAPQPSASAVFLQPRLFLDSTPIRAALRGDVESVVASTVSATARRGRLG